ncbi:extracellular solute-binding protein [Edaphobacter aggregans]|uniref:extracellular solute-binding protein n=1 Tax=Edaphobacter aggregans TaxID=570835 RepID=UPI000690BF28|nr:extracellular solute-binding protein [Edaphobacter aggregans]
MLKTRRNVIAGLGSILLDCASGCHRAKPEPVTIMFMDPEWSHDRSQRSFLSEGVLRQFEKETGIKVKHLPAPETSDGQLKLIQELLAEKDTPDVFGIDIVWSGLLDDGLLDLKPFFSAELSAAGPDVVESVTVQSRVIAIPYRPHVGVLLYRNDLLTKYGYHVPPQTWSELEKMAFRIQEGERAAGEKGFWGFVWPGAADEGLTCLALEWQASEGGGRIIEANRTISVNNENAIRAWQRAARWIGWISPPSVTAYEEWDSINHFGNSGKAAFGRGWTSDYFLTNPAKSMIDGEMGVTSVPSGSLAVGTLGGFGLGISKRSKHQREAIALVKFLLHKKSELEAASTGAELPTGTALYRLPTVLKAYSRSIPAGQPVGESIVSRPSMVVGRNYDDVSRAYAQAVHSVLTRKKSAPEAAAELETELERITGFPKGLPEATEYIPRK